MKWLEMAAEDSSELELTVPDTNAASTSRRDLIGE